MANQIKCPKCGEVFQVDESGYAEILRDVRNKEFEKELKARESHIRSEHEHELSDLKLKLDKERSEQISQTKLELAK